MPSVISGFFRRKARKFAAGENRQAGVNARSRVGRAGVPVEQGHFAEKLADAQFRRVWCRNRQRPSR